MTLLEQAIRAYTGDYLEEQSDIWCVDLQEGLRRKHVACLKGLASLHLSAGAAERAIPLLETAVAKTHYDPLAIDLLFRAYVLARDVNSMVAFYEKEHERPANGTGKNGPYLIEERFAESYRAMTGKTFK